MPVSRPTVVLIDNFDSFVFNLARYLEELGCETRVARNDSVTVDDLRRMSPAAIVISPGPCTPREAGVSLEVVRQLGPSVPMLGVCLGHQAMADALGGRVIRAHEPVHGRTSLVQHRGSGLFRDLPNPLQAMRYHSLIVDESALPVGMNITAWTEDGVPMALEHDRWPMYGVQFHPESILTPDGHRLLSNFLIAAGLEPAGVPPGDAFRPQEPGSLAEIRVAGQPIHW